MRARVVVVVVVVAVLGGLVTGENKSSSTSHVGMLVKFIFSGGGISRGEIIFSSARSAASRLIYHFR